MMDKLKFVVAHTAAILLLLTCAALAAESDEDESSSQDYVLPEEVISAPKPVSCASYQEILDKDFETFPRQNPSDLLRLVPGLHVTQHTGGAKAHQIFLRGFDAEHGQDVAGYLDGIPLNEPSQIHGHGYLDLHFLIPETLKRIRIIKGPYDPEFGNFATAGAIDFIPKRIGDNSSVGATYGSFNTVRGLGVLSLSPKSLLIYGAVEGDRTDGFTDPGWAYAHRAFMSLTLASWASSTLNLIYSHYYQDSAAADVVPENLVESGELDRFGSIDDTDGVTSGRELVGLTWDYSSGLSSARIQAYYNYKDTVIFSNYTFYYFHPELGDQQEMKDRRHYFGLNAYYLWPLVFGHRALFTKFGLQVRSDLVHQVLAYTHERERFDVVKSLDFSETSIGAYVREEADITKWLRFVGGIRFDTILYQGSGTQDERYFNIYTNRPDTRQDVERDWSNDAWAVSPKASLIFSPFGWWDIFLNYGEGFFSNTTDRMANYPSEEIPKVRGGEFGNRWFAWKRRITLSAAVWYLYKEEDMVFDPQTALAIERGASQRYGLDFDSRISPLSWLYLVNDLFWIHGEFLEPEVEPIPNIPIFMVTNAVGWRHPKGWKGMVRSRYLGARRLDQDDWADPYWVVDLVAAFESKRFATELAIDNLFNTEWRDSVFSYQSRPEQNGDVFSGIHFTPGTPLAARLTVTAKF
ncbi:MAG TPA: hypothetical protein ENF73_01800 [Proteobacteria bacterium]|nr:hypothetical protein [Pseudomonadota bacterium]